MSKKIEFNKGLLTKEKQDVTWELPTSEVHCVSHGELNYLKDNIKYAIPLDKLDQKEKYLYLSWKIPENYKSISSVFDESDWYKLKTAKNLLEVAKFFNDRNDLTTVFDVENLYVDEYHNVVVVFYANKLHLPKKYDNHSDLLWDIKKIIALLLTSENEKKINAMLSKNNDKEESQGVIGKIILATKLQELKQVVDIEYDHFLARQDEFQANQDLKMRRQKRVLFSGGLVFLMLTVVLFFFVFNKNDDSPKIEELEEALEKEEQTSHDYQQQVESYEAYFNDDLDKSMKVAKEINKSSDDLNEPFYIELLVQNGEVHEAIEQYPEQTPFILDRITELEMRKAIQDYESDDPYVQFEQAIMAEDTDKLKEIIPELENPTDRQKQLIFEYYLENNIDEAIEYAERQKNNEWQVTALEGKVESLDKKKDKEEISEIEKEIEELSD